MSVGRRYVTGLLALAAAATGLAALLPGSLRPAAFTAVGLALLVQAPLGWWLVESVGKPRFLGVWVAGMLARLALVGLAGLVLVPALGLRADAVLLPLALLLLVFVLLEGIVLMGPHSIEIR